MCELRIIILFIVEQTEAQSSEAACSSLGPRPELCSFPHVLSLHTLGSMIQVGTSGEKQTPIWLLQNPQLQEQLLSPNSSK